MVKLVAMLKKKDGMSDEEFMEHWTETHVPIAKQFPNLREYKIGIPLDPDETGADPIYLDYDGTATLRWDSLEDYEEARKSELVREAQEDLEHFTDTDRVVKILVREREIELD